MATRKRNVLLTLQQRLDIVKELNKVPVSVSSVARKYNVSRTTVFRIAKNATRISAFANKTKGQKKRRKIVEPVYGELDQQLLQWFIERRALGDHLTDALISEKAAEIKASLPSCANFKVSYGWLVKFKARHDIRLANLRGERSSADVDAMEAFVENFNKLIKEENINLENVYNMAESGIVWKALPTKPLAQKAEGNVGEYKFRKDRITVAFCANALGTNKLKPMVIYKYKNPRALKYSDHILPVIFKSQKNAWMDRSLFLDWYENHFKPSVREYQEEEGLGGKVILIVDNCEAHKVPPEIENEDNFRILYLPPNTTSILQPMDQGVIEKTKRSFRHKMLSKVLRYDGGMQEFYKHYTIKDCIEILQASWQEITRNNIKNSWNKFLGKTPTPTVVTRSSREIEPNIQEAINLITGENCTRESMQEYLSACEEIESRNSRQLVKEEDTAEELQEEPFDYYEGVTFDDDEATRNEISHILDRLSFYANRAPGFIQLIVNSLRLFFIGRES